MSFLGRIAGREERQATLSAPPAWLVDAFGMGGSTIGEKVTPEKALGLVPIYSAVGLIAGAVGTLPLIVYKGGDRAPDSPYWRLLHDRPNPEMAADEVWEIVMSHLLLWGNAFLYKTPGGRGVAELWPISPSRCTVGRVDGQRVIEVDGRRYTDRDILHVRGLSDNGLVGYSPIQVAKQAIANALGQEKFQAEFLANGGRPATVLKHPQQMSNDAQKRLKAGWRQVENGGTAVLEEGITVEKLTMPLNDAQFIEQQQFSDLRIAQLFNLPPSRLGAKTGDSLTYSTAEREGQEFVTYTLRRWLARIENSLKRDADLLPRDLYAEFLVEGLLRADTKSRYDAYKVAIEAGFMTENEVRERENLPPLEGVSDEA